MVTDAKKAELAKIDKEIKELLLQGKGTNEIVRLVGTNQPRVLKIREELIAEGHNIKPKRSYTDFQEKVPQCIALWKSGMSSVEIARVLGVSKNWVYTHLQYHMLTENVQPVQKGKKYKKSVMPENVRCEWDDVVLKISWEITRVKVLNNLRKRREVD